MGETEKPPSQTRTSRPITGLRPRQTADKVTQLDQRVTELELSPPSGLTRAMVTGMIQNESGRLTDAFNVSLGLLSDRVTKIVGDQKNRDTGQDNRITGTENTIADVRGEIVSLNIEDLRRKVKTNTDRAVDNLNRLNVVDNVISNDILPQLRGRSVDAIRAASRTIADTLLDALVSSGRFNTAFLANVVSLDNNINSAQNSFNSMRGDFNSWKTNIADLGKLENAGDHAMNMFVSMLFGMIDASVLLKDIALWIVDVVGKVTPHEQFRVFQIRL